MKHRNTSFPALSVYPRVGISLYASEAGVRFYFSCSRVCGISLTMYPLEAPLAGRNMLTMHR